MNSLLRRLASALPASAPPELRREWSNFVIHQNVCAVPAPDLPMGTAYWQRGCLLLMLDRRGAPTHLAKLRPVGEPNTAYEGQVLHRLWSVREIRPYVPAAHWASTDGAQLLLTAYSPGKPYLLRLRRLSDRAWTRDMRELLQIAHLISDRAAASFPDFAQSEKPFLFATEAQPALESATALGLGGEGAQCLTAFLRSAGSVTRSPQHGDLWPGNVLRDGDRWRLVDFEMFGKVQAPLFDDIHLLRTSLIARAGAGAEAWLTQAESGSRRATEAVSLLVEVSKGIGLDLTRTMACIIYYLSTMAHRFRSAELPTQMATPILLDLEAVAGALRDGSSALSCLRTRF